MSNADSGAAAPRSFVRLVEWRYVLAAIGLAIALAAYGPSGRVAYNRSIENMFASGDRIVEPYQRLKRVFGGNELVLAVYVDPELLEPDGRGIRRLSEISQRLQKVPGVREVLSLDRPVGDVIVDAKNPAAAALRDVFAGIPIKVDLIDVTDPTGRYQPPDAAELKRFRDHLQVLKSPIARRYSGGKDIGAACGTLEASQRGGTLLQPHLAENR